MKLTSKQIAQQADDKIISEAGMFVVNWFKGRDYESYRTLNVIREKLWDRAEFSSLGEARRAQTEAGKDEHGRLGLLYAVSKTGITVFVDQDYEKRREECLSK